MKRLLKIIFLKKYITKVFFLNIYKMELCLMEREESGEIGYEKYEELRILDYKSQMEILKHEIERLKKQIEWHEKMLEFEKAFLKRGKELFEKIEKSDEEIDEEIDKDYKTLKNVK